MKLYSQAEKDEAEKKLAKPTHDFLGSDALVRIYTGLEKKFKLNLQEVLAMTELTGTVLMGLEPESALETGLHQWMPELSNATAKELAADIHDRVFKEASRRLQENILEPEPKKIGEEGITDEDVARQETDTQIAADIAKEEAAAKEKGKTVEELEANLLREEEAKRLGITVEELAKQEALEAATAAELDWNAPEPVSTEEEEKTETPVVPAGPIEEKTPLFAQKLAAPAVAKPETVIVAAPISGIQNVAVVKTETPVPPAEPMKKIYPGGGDPYREPIE